LNFTLGQWWIRNFNIDLIGHEIYFSKQAVMAQLEPTIFLCHQMGGIRWGTAGRTTQNALQQIGDRAYRDVVESCRPGDGHQCCQPHNGAKYP